MKKFIVLCTARTGSNYLMNLLSGHDNIKVVGEIFNLDVLSQVDLLHALDNPIDYFHRKLDYSRNPTIKAVGAKIFYEHFTFDYFSKFISVENASAAVRERIIKLQKYLDSSVDKVHLGETFKKTWNYLIEEKTLNVIHLKRKNTLKSLISLKRAYLTNEWMKIGKLPVQNSIKLKLEVEECLRFFEHVKQNEGKYDELFSSHEKMDVFYEDLDTDKEAVVTEIIRFLSLSPYEPSSIMKKQISEPIEEVLENYNELKERFKNTEWDIFFEESAFH